MGDRVRHSPREDNRGKGGTVRFHGASWSGYIAAMPAFVPRNVFATPFVVTVAACGAGEAPAPTEPTSAPTTEITPTNPPAPTDPNEHVSPPPSASVAASAAPSADLAATSPERKWTLMKQGKGCATVPVVHCPEPKPGVPTPTCNPPPAMAYPCPPGPELTGEGEIVRAAGSTECTFTHPTIYPDTSKMHCPKGARCNPPPPQHFDPVKVECPKM
jgi:hypothetical protein